MSDNFISSSNDIFHRVYGSNPSLLESNQSEEIKEPKVIYQNEKDFIIIMDFENDINKKDKDESKEEVASIYEIIKKVKFIDINKSTSKFIYELSNGFIIISAYDKHLFLYNKNLENIVKILFPLPVNYVIEEKTIENYLINLKCFVFFSIYDVLIDLQNHKTTVKKCDISKVNEQKEENKDAQDDEKNKKDKKDNECKIKHFYFNSMIQLKNSQDFLFTNNGIYVGENLLNQKEIKINFDLLIQYTEAVLLNDNLICLKSNKQLTNGEDSLTIFDIKNKKVIKKIDGFSFNINPYRLILIAQNENNKILVGACTKYSSDQKNGLFIAKINLEKEEEIEIKKHFEEIKNFNVSCICNLNLNNNNDKEENENEQKFLFIGGVSEEYNKGMIKLYKLDLSENEINIEFLQDMELDEDLEGTISYIYQLKNGKLIISSGSGNILFTAPNLDGYKE